MAAVTGIVATVTLRALPQTDGAIEVDGLNSSVTVLRDPSGHRPDPRRAARTTCSSPRATSTPRNGSGRWRSGATSRPAGCRSCSARARSTRIGSSGRSAGDRPRSGTSRRSRTRRRAAVDAYTDGVNAYIDGHRGGLGTGVRRHGRPERDRRHRRLRPRAVDRARLGGLAEGPGLAARRQLRIGGLPDAGRRPARRSGADRRAVPRLSGGHAGDHAVSDGHGGRAERRRRASPPTRDPTDLAAPSITAAAGRGVARRRHDRRRVPSAGGPRRRRRAGERPPDRVEQLGRRPVAERQRRRAPGQRPASRHLDAVGLVHERAALPDGHATPARTTSSASRSRAFPASSSATTPGSRGARRTSTPTSRTCSSKTVDPAQPGQLPVPGRVRPVHGARGDDQGRRRRTTSSSRSARPATGRSSTTSTRVSRMRHRCCAPLDGDRGGRRHARRGLQAQHGRDVRGVPRRVRHVRLARPELRLRRRRRAHRLRRSRATSRSARIRPIVGRASGRAATASTSGRAEFPFEDLPWQLDPPGGIIVTREQRRGRRLLPVLRRLRVGSGLPGEADHRAAG